MAGRHRLWISFNAFHSDDPEVLEALSESYDPDWLSTETLAPDRVEIVEIESDNLRLAWSGGGPQELEGHTIIEHSLSGGDWTPIGETAERSATTFDIGRPGDGLSHHYRLRTVTDPHENNHNTVVSDPSEIVTFNPSGHWALPAVARLQGAGGFFSSTLHAFNAGSADLEMEVAYTPRSDIGGEPRTAIWALGAGEAATIDDALEALFGPVGDEPMVGPLLINVIEGRPDDLLLRSVITATHFGGGEFGQAFPASRFRDGLRAGETAHLHLGSGRTRTNAGLVALEPESRASFRLVGPIGTVLSDPVVFEGEPGASLQLNELTQVFGMVLRENSLVELSVDQGSVLAYGSILDGNASTVGTSDPTTVKPFLEGTEIITLLEMGDITGYEEYSGSGSMTNTTDEGVTVTAEFHQRGLPGVTATTEFELQAGETRVFDNLVIELFDLEDVVGTITMETDARGLVATGREFSVFRNDQGEITGTSGQLMRGLTTRDVLWPDETYHLIGLRQDRQPSGHRTNVAAFNPVSTTATITLELFDQATGVSEGTTTFEVCGEELIHINAVISEINPDHDEAQKRIVVTTDGPVYLQAFEVNPTGDPVTVDVLRE